MGISNARLCPIHVPHPANGGIAINSDQSAFPGLWDGHVSSWVPCFHEHGETFPFIGAGPPPRSGVALLRRWAWQGSFLTNHDEYCPTGYGFYTGPGAFVFVRDGYADWTPWNSRDGIPAAPHSYLAVVKLPNSTGPGVVRQYLYMNNPRTAPFQNWKGEHLVFNTTTMVPEIWAGGNTSTVQNTGCNQWFTQDNAMNEGQWHTICWTVHDWSDVRIVVDGRMETSMINTGTYAGDPVYVSPNSIRMFWERTKTSNDLAVSLLQVFDRPLSDTEMVERTLDPLAMFEPKQSLEPAAGLSGVRVVNIGQHVSREVIAYGG